MRILAKLSSDSVHFIRHSMLVSCALLCLSLSVSAEQEVPLEDEEILQVFNMSLKELLKLTVVTASRVEEELRDAPANIHVISARQIRNRGYTSLEQVLFDQASIFVSPASDAVSYNKVSIRGVMGNNKFIVLQDGIRISGPSGEDIPIAGNFPLYHVKQIEIILGPASALYGADAFTGVINLITESGSDDSGPHRQVKLSSGSDQFQRFEFYHQYALGGNNFMSVGAHKEESNGPDLSSAYPQLFPINDLAGFDGDVIINAGDRGEPKWPSESESLNLKLTIGDQLVAGYIHSSFTHSSATSNLPDTADYDAEPSWQTDHDTLYLKNKFALSDRWDSSLSLSYSEYQVDPKSKFTNIFTRFDDGYKYAFSSRVDFSQQFTLTTSQNGLIVTGFDIQKFSALPKSADLSAPFEPNLPAERQNFYYQGTNNELATKIYQVDWRNLGGFIEWKKDLSSNLNTFIGVRYDDSSTYGNSTNPRLGLIWKQRHNSQFKLLYGESFLAPSPRFTYEHFGSFAYLRDDGLYQSFFIFVPNPDLKPEKLKDLELNYQYQWQDNLRLELSYFKQRITNLIFPVDTPELDDNFIEGGIIVRSQHNANIGQVDSNGFDIGLVYNTILADGIFSLWSNFSYVDGELKLAEQQIVNLPYSAKQQFKIGTTYETENWSLSGSYYRIGKASQSEVPETVGQFTDAYNLAKANFRYIASSKLTLNLTIDNLFDTRFYAPGVGITTFENVPQAGRSVQFGLCYQF